MGILNEIVKHKKIEVEKNKTEKPVSLLEQSIQMNRDAVSLSTHVKKGKGIIAEFKRRSPSKPKINLNADPKIVSKGYASAGASAISVLTDEHYFGGSTHDLLSVRKQIDLPILRKDFIIDPYQILEARSIGADAILLIAEVLTKNQAKQLARYATKLGLEVLMEIHSEDQLSKFNDDIALIGVNNRNLKTF